MSAKEWFRRMGEFRGATGRRMYPAWVNPRNTPLWAHTAIYHGWLQGRATFDPGKRATHQGDKP